MIATQWSTFLWSAGGILLMLTLAFRGPVLALLAILPTLLAVGLVLGLMGWLGIKLDIATALVASVALGLSVDDTFHCLLQFRRHRAGAPLPREPARQLRRDRPRRPAVEPRRGGRLRRPAVQRVRPVRPLRHDGLHRHRRQLPGQPGPPARLPEPRPASRRSTDLRGSRTPARKIVVNAMSGRPTMAVWSADSIRSKQRDPPRLQLVTPRAVDRPIRLDHPGDLVAHERPHPQGRHIRVRRGRPPDARPPSP